MQIDKLKEAIRKQYPTLEDECRQSDTGYCYHHSTEYDSPCPAFLIKELIAHIDEQAEQIDTQADRMQSLLNLTKEQAEQLESVSLQLDDAVGMAKGKKEDIDRLEKRLRHAREWDGSRDNHRQLQKSDEEWGKYWHREAQLRQEHIDEQAEQLANVREVLKGQKAIGFREGYELAKERIGAERDRLQRIVDRINGQLVDGGENPLDELDRQITALEGKLAIARDALKKYLANWEFDSDNPKPLREALEQIREKEGA